MEYNFVCISEEKFRGKPKNNSPNAHKKKYV